MKRVLLVASKTGYQVREFASAAEALGMELVLATDRCHILDDPWGDRAVAVDFENPESSAEAVAARGPYQGVLAVGDQPAKAASTLAALLGLRFHPPEAAAAAGDKFRTRTCFRNAGLKVPEFHLLGPGVTLEQPVKYPCVVKPLHSSASRGVIRADDPGELSAAVERIRKMGEQELLVEEFIPGREFALEGVVTAGRLQILALFDKPDPLDGPFFEETIYVTPSRLAPPVQGEIRETAAAAVAALGLRHGPVHAEMRVNAQGVWMLEVAARPIGGLCSRILRFGGEIFEHLLLRHAAGEDVTGARLTAGAQGVMMIPIPQGGIYRGVSGTEQARGIPYIEDVVITAKEGQKLVPLPEGNTYVGFLFSRAGSADEVEEALRKAHELLSFEIAPTLTIVK